MSAVQLHRFLLRAALAGAHAYAWIGIFAVTFISTGSLSIALSTVSVLYALTQVIVILLTPIAAQNLVHGMRRPLTLGVLCAAAAFAMLGFGYLYGGLALLRGVSIFAVLFGVYRAFYFVPYQLAMHAPQRTAFLEILLALMPALSALLIVSLPHMPEALNFGAAGLMLLSLLPIFKMNEQHEGFAWGYRETFHELFATKRRTLLLSSVVSGMESTALLLIWPITAWLILGRSLVLLGAALSLSLLLTMVVRLVLQKLAWTFTPTQEALVHVSAWLFRVAAGSGSAIVLIDVYTGAGAPPQHRGMDSTAHEQSADNHTYLDEHSALKEMGNALGRIIMCLCVLALAPLVSFNIAVAAVFVLAAAFGTLSIFAAHRHAREAF